LSLVIHEAQKHLEAETVDNERFRWMSYFRFIDKLMEFIRSRFKRVGTATWLRAGRSRVRILERKFFFLKLADRIWDPPIRIFKTERPLRDIDISNFAPILRMRYLSPMHLNYINNDKIAFNAISCAKV
jgi:hypothetical protein